MDVDRFMYQEWFEMINDVVTNLEGPKWSSAIATSEPFLFCQMLK